MAKKIFEDGYSHVAGNPGGDVTIVEFFDYRCAYCKRARPEVLKLLETDTNVRLILKEYPILGDVSQQASAAAMAAAMLDASKYFDFHMSMMSEPSLKPETIWELAGQAGYDVEQLKAAAKDKVIEERIAANRDLGASLGVDGTPMFLIGGELIGGLMTAEEFAEKIAAVRGGG
jgi:protein-disulfide isomerase